MRSFADAVLALTLAAGLAAVPIVGGSLAQQRPDADQSAPRLAARVATLFNERFGGLYSRNPLDGAYRPLPTVRAEEFRLVGDDPSFQRLIREPQTGMAISVTVDKASGLVAFGPLEFPVR